jgi:hypothetical protein
VLVVPQLELGKVIAQYPVIRIVPVVVRRAAHVTRPTLLGRLADAVHLVRLRRAVVLATVRRLSIFSLATYRVTVLIIVLRFAVELLLKAGDPLVDRLLCLLETLLDVLTDLWEVVCDR